jgi:hypothetical protein
MNSRANAASIATDSRRRRRDPYSAPPAKKMLSAIGMSKFKLRSAESEFNLFFGAKKLQRDPP